MKKEIKSVVECKTHDELCRTITDFVGSLFSEEKLVAIEAKLAFKRDNTPVYVASLTTFVGELPTPGSE